MFIMLPSMVIILVYVLAAVLPAAFLLRYIYKKDTIEKEPPRLLISLLAMGVLAALASMVLEEIGDAVLSRFLQSGSEAYTIAFAFLVVAVVEEGTKFIFLKLRTWRSPYFNYRFDGVVYAVFVSLGFAAFENICYVFGYGLSVAVPRALLAIPAHMGFSVFMGSYYGRAKICEADGKYGARNGNLWTGYILAVLLHGFYDTCAMLGSSLATVLFAAFVIIMYVVVIRRIRRETATDEPI